MYTRYRFQSLRLLFVITACAGIILLARHDWWAFPLFVVVALGCGFQGGRIYERYERHEEFEGGEDERNG